MTPSEIRSNYIKAVRFDRPDFIPMQFHINGACWNHYPIEELKQLIYTHPFLFPKPENWCPPEGYQPIPVPKQPISFVDDWGCVWQTPEQGITGVVTGHPLDDWGKLDSYVPPDPSRCMGIGPIDWQQVQQSISGTKQQGGLVGAGLRHGHTFLQLCDIRGYENLIFDMADDEPNLYRLIDMVEQFNMEIVRRYVSLGLDFMGYAEDLGMQVGPMLSPKQFCKYIKPSYQRLMQPAKQAGCIVHMHSDGDIRSLYQHIVDGGVDVMNLQDLVNGIDWIKDNVKGKSCIELDIDRQKVTRFGTPAEIDALIRQEVAELGSKEGGLMMVFGLYHGTPIGNAKALMDAMERYAFYYS